jgi:hypothetical protein
MDRGFFISLQAVRRQLAAMPCDLYLLRLIHHGTHKPFPMECLWAAVQLAHPAMVRFLRLRNSQGHEVFFRPFVQDRSAGYVLVDLDAANPATIPKMRAGGHPPCVVLQTSPGHLQAWVRVCPAPLQPALATAFAKHLARLYGGDLASAEGRHLGRLAGFTNQKPCRRQPNGYAPWVRLLYAQPGSLSSGRPLLDPDNGSAPSAGPRTSCAAPSAERRTAAPALTPAAATAIYRRWLQRLHILERFPQPDWSIADLWIAQRLLACRLPAEQVQAVLRLGSPGFPRRHSDPDDYLHRTLLRAAYPPNRPPFLARRPQPLPPRQPPPATCVDADPLQPPSSRLSL